MADAASGPDADRPRRCATSPSSPRSLDERPRLRGPGVGRPQRHVRATATARSCASTSITRVPSRSSRSTTSGRVLLIQQYRHPIRLRDWEIPAGLLDVEGEAPLETAQRELAEEADLVGRRLEPLAQRLHDARRQRRGRPRLPRARPLAGRPRRTPREAEEADIRIEWVPLDGCRRRRARRAAAQRHPGDRACSPRPRRSRR